MHARAHQEPSAALQLCMPCSRREPLSGQPVARPLGIHWRVSVRDCLSHPLGRLVRVDCGARAVGVRLGEMEEARAVGGPHLAAFEPELEALLLVERQPGVPAIVEITEEKVAGAVAKRTGGRRPPQRQRVVLVRG